MPSLTTAARLGRLAIRVWLAWRSYRAYERLPSLDATYPPGPGDGSAPGVSAPPGEGSPTLSIIVPARDEAHNLPRLLPSLTAQDYTPLEIIVVDDGSADDTAGVARRLGARVVAAGPLPPGWAGKPHACLAGANAAVGDWLLFTDADTWHAPDGARRALAYAHAHDLDALSLFLRQECRTRWERLLLPYAYRHFFAGVDARAVNDDHRRASLLNGQYLLIRRDAYGRAGGHAAVRASIVEDVAFGHVLKVGGVRLRMARGEAVAAVRMYTGLGAIIAGFAKNSLRFALDDPRRGALVIASTLLAAQPLLAGVRLARRPRRTEALDLAVGLAVEMVALVPWQRRFGTPIADALLQPVAALLFQAIALAGLWSTVRRGGTRWKGRRY